MTRQHANQLATTITSPYGTDHGCTSNATWVRDRVLQPSSSNHKSNPLFSSSPHIKHKSFSTEPRLPPLESKGTNAFTLLLQESLVELVNDGNGKKDSGSCSDSSHKVSNDGKGSDAHATKGSSSRDVAVEDVDEGRVTVSLHHHLVVTKLLGNITSRSSRHLDPCLGKESTRSQNEDEVEDSMERIVDNLGERRRGRNVVSNSSNGDHLPSRPLNILPRSQKTHEDVGWRTVVEKLGHKVQVRNESCLQNDRHVGSVEKLDGVVALLSTVLLVLDGKIHTPSLEVNDNHKDEDGCHQVG